MRRHGTLIAGWAFALVLIAAFSSLGAWQLRRGAEKQAVLDASARVLAQRSAVPLAAAQDARLSSAYTWAAGPGRFAPAPPVLLDNQQRNGRVGIRVFRVFLPDSGGELLVDLGWLALPGDRTVPAAALAGAPVGQVQVRGLLAPPPSPGLALGEPMSKRAVGSGEAWLATRIDRAAVDGQLGDPQRPLAPRVLRLDPAVPGGFERDLVLLANTLPPEKHRGYAVQWFGLAIAAFVTALILTFRRKRR
ncbi:SURF1 family protein [Lysobacter korlensis]|uniref:SURF1-like protein n=1 Tax=Lysobacter korlensis TaxID=553636 RepID=A0ABV6RR78_9GAMM